jgi:hypothetical protein
VICWTESSCCYSTKITLLIEWSHRYTKIYGHHHEPVDRYEYLFLKWQWLFSPFSFLYHFSRTWQWVTWWVSYQTQAKYLPFTSTYLCSRFLAMSVMLILLFSVLRVLFLINNFICDINANEIVDQSKASGQMLLSRRYWKFLLIT